MSATTGVDTWDLPDDPGEVIAVYVHGVELSRDDWAASGARVNMRTPVAVPGTARRGARRGAHLGGPLPGGPGSHSARATARRYRRRGRTTGAPGMTATGLLALARDPGTAHPVAGVARIVAGAIFLGFSLGKFIRHDAEAAAFERYRDPIR